MDLYINDDLPPVAGVTIKPGEEALRQRLYIPHGYLRQGVNRLHYKVFRVGGNTSEDSRDLLVLYHLRTPDNLDLVIPPDVIKDGVSAERAAQGVVFGFTYNNRRPYDRIRLRIGDTEVTFDVADGNAPITHTLFTDAFRAAGDNSSAVVDFIVTDQLGNPSKSPEKRLDIHLDRMKLEKPILREDQNDNGDDPSVVDLDLLKGRPLLVVIVPDATIYREGDDVVATYRSTQPDAELKIPGKITASFGVLQPCILQVPNAQVISGSQLNVTFELTRGDQIIGTSQPAIASVIGGSVPDEKPVITLLTGLPSGKEIPNGGTTEETAGTLTGTASKGLQIEVLDNQTESKGKATADGAGKWSHQVAGLQEGAHSLTAKALYGSGQVSVARTFMVEAAQADVRPAIVSVFGQDGEINNGAVIEDTSVVLSGTAKANQKLQIFENEQPKDEVNVDHNGDWVQPLANLSKGTYILKARALYGTGLDSNIRFFTVKSPGSDLEFDEQPASISAFRHIFSDHPAFEPVNPSAGSFLDRPAKNGKPPYQYKSDNTNVASVNKDGRVYAYKNGETEISVTDSTGTTRKFKLTTSGTFYEWKYIGKLDHKTAKSEASNTDGTLPSLVELQSLCQVYESGPNSAARTWSSTTHPDYDNACHAINLTNNFVSLEYTNNVFSAYALIK
ncbi:Ig-like domain-containing protein [Pseudomonas baetica]|uniref:Ig-like domain-containing protein n=1 Tax=Pseudomonas baetica TaxID=674054 RepID=UPI00186411E0|nr:Ig-like domain-containing protein [Pseudomonas baetica]